MPRKQQQRKRAKRSRAAAAPPMKTPAVVNRLRRVGKERSMVRGLLPMLGSMAGNYLGGPAGGAVGSAAGKLISTITGYGDYKVNRNSVIQGNSVPTFRQGGHGMRVCHREFLFNVTGSTEFSVQRLAINPGLIATFPWLSALAVNFEEYELDGLVFEYRPSSGSAVSSTSSALGVVILATDYDAANGPFVSKQQMESYEFSTSTVPFTGCMHPVECKRGLNVLNSLFLRTADPPLGTDIRMYDMGNFSIATQGMQAAYEVGELWVSYDVVFKKPRLPGPSSTLGLQVLHLINEDANTSYPGVLWGTTGHPSVVLDTTMTETQYESTSTGIILKETGTYFVSFFSDTEGVDGVSPYLELGANVTNGPMLVHRSTQNNWAYSSQYNVSLFMGYIKVTTAGTGDANKVSPIYYTSVGGPAGNFELWVQRISYGLVAPPAKVEKLSDDEKMRPRIDKVFLKDLVLECLAEKDKLSRSKYLTEQFVRV